MSLAPSLLTQTLSSSLAVSAKPLSSLEDSAVLQAKIAVIDDELYKVAKRGPLLTCVTPEEAEYILRKIHEGVCGHP